MEQTLSRQDVAQLLRETGCTDEFTRRFLTAMDDERTDLQLRLLREQRTRQLGRLHEEEKKLDELDFLRYKLEKQPPKGSDRP